MNARNDSQTVPAHVPARRASWDLLAERVLDGADVTSGEALAILQSPDEELLDVLAAAYRIRRRYFGQTVQLHFLMNAKSGLCPEDCAYCSQSKVSEADIPRYNLLSRDEILASARAACERKAGTYCIVISARGPAPQELDALGEIVPEIKRRYDLKICVSLGLLTTAQAQRLKDCGVDRVNHNLNTSGQYYGEICTTHSFEDRVDTLRAIRAVGLEICSGGIAGMGERPIDLVRMALLLRELQVESIPVNFLNPIAGTPLAGTRSLNPRICLRILAMFRFTNPDRQIRIAAGRELHLGCLQPLGLYAANSLFVGDYLTTAGQPAEDDLRMIEAMGFAVETVS